MSVRFEKEEGDQFVARFPDGAAVAIRPSRARFYPGLTSEAPSTSAYYELACEELAGARRVVDVGCGVGTGSAILSGSFDEVVGVDRDEGTVQFARRTAERCAFTKADFAEYEAAALFDGAVLVDVLGQVESPYQVLRALRRALRLGAKILVAEASAYPAQSLRTPARRAFSARALRGLLGAAGFEVVDWPATEGSFSVCVAQAIDDSAAVELARGAEGVPAVLEPLSLDEKAPKAVRLEAALALADFLFSTGDGDGAGKAYFRARELDPSDPRALAGLSQIALAIGQPKDAVALSAMALRLEPSEPSAASVHAMALERTHPADALAAWRIAVSLAPDSAAIVGRFVEVAVARQDLASALSALERLRSYGDALGSQFHLLTASVLLAGGRRADALLEARLAVAGAPNDPSVKAFWDRMNAA